MKSLVLITTLAVALGGFSLGAFAENATTAASGPVAAAVGNAQQDAPKHQKNHKRHRRHRRHHRHQQNQQPAQK